jgi:signal transduction histidine kinase
MGSDAARCYDSRMGQASERARTPSVERLVADVTKTRTGRTLATADLVLDIATAASVDPGLESVLRMAVDRLAEIVDFSSGAIALVEGDTLMVRAIAGQRRRGASGPRIAPGSSPRWKVLDELRPIRVDDLRRPSAIGSRAPRAWLGAPIVRGDEALGLVELESRTPGAFSVDDERIVATVARALGGPVDVAERYKAAQRAQELREAFTGVISHELRTPITTIYGMSQVLRQRHGSMEPADLRHMIEDIEGEADRLRRLAEDLLVLSRTESGRLQVTLDPLLMGHVIRRRIAEEESRWPDHEFEAQIPIGIGLVLGEEMYVEQVVQNLLSNAAKYSPPGSTVRVVVEQEGAEVIVRVLDEGIGLAGEATDRLFELFYRSPDATRQASGAGIGLFVCRQLIESMGGRIWARQREGRGSEFGFGLPVLEESDPDDILE